MKDLQDPGQQKQLGMERFGEQLVEAVGRRQRSRRRLRRTLLPVAAAGAMVPAAFAIASIDDGGEPRVLEAGDKVTIGFLDPETDKPLRCPDGTLLTWRIEAGQPTTPAAECADGSVPDVYKDFRERERRYLDELSAGDPMTDAPSLPTFEVDSED